MGSYNRFLSQTAEGVPRFALQTNLNALKNKSGRSSRNGSIIGNEYTIGPGTGKHIVGPPTGALKPGATTALGTLRHHKAVGSWMNDTQTGVKIKEGGSS